jgi:hypothetical protein
MAKDPNIDPDWTPPVDRAEQQTPDPIAELKAQLAREQAARADAEKRANELAQAAHSSQNEVADSQLQLVTSAIERVKEQRTLIRNAKAQAAAAGDWDAVAVLDDQLADEAARQLQLENGKAAMEAQPKPQAPQPIRTMSQDPVEALASQLTPRSAAWVRAHPECARDQKLYAKMIAAHNLAVANDIEPDSDEYFHTVEQTIYNKKPVTNVEENDDDDDDDPMAAAAKAVPARAAAPPAAPVSRGSVNTRSMRLTPAEREAAEISGQTEQEYAQAKEDMIKAGRIGQGRIH